MKEHIDDAPMRLVEKLNKEDKKIADARAWRVAFQAWKSSLTRAEKTPRAYESIADLRDCVCRNEMLPLNPAESDAALGRDVGAGGGAGFASRDEGSLGGDAGRGGGDAAPPREDVALRLPPAAPEGA
eukprot:jgi/Tetstr1/463555/TSEL_008434.t1